jgi:hypothetical protein
VDCQNDLAYTVHFVPHKSSGTGNNTGLYTRTQDFLQKYSGGLLRLWMETADAFFATGVEFSKVIGNLRSALLESIYCGIRVFTVGTVKLVFIKSSPLQKTLQEQCVFSKKLYAHFIPPLRAE